MPISTLTAGTVMNMAAVLLNDKDRTQYTYPIQVPFVQMALQELQEYYELHSLAVTEDVSAIIQINAGLSEITYGTIDPKLPDDLVEPQQVWERTRNVNPFVPMTRREYLPHSLEGVTISQLIFYVWQSQKMRFIAANQNNDIKIDYIKQLFTTITDQTSIINIVNAQTFLEFRTAGLIAEFIEHDESSATKYNGYASLAMDRATGITVKGKQTIMTRRRPFRSGYKHRGRIS